MTDAARLIDALDLAPHPEGGWYRETWRAPAADGERAIATAIHFLLERGQSSHWHRVDAAEVWLWHVGDPLELRLAADDTAAARSITLGPDVLAGQAPQHVVAPGEWQAAAPLPHGTCGYTLVSCIVTPAFQFSGFTLAAPNWEPGA